MTAKSASLPTDAKARKNIPLARGLLDYFPDALCEVAELSRIGNEQHNPGQPIHWAKEKSTDHADCVLRHMIDRGTLDNDGVRHATKVAWRALALLQIELDEARRESAEFVKRRAAERCWSCYGPRDANGQCIEQHNSGCLYSSQEESDRNRTLEQ